MAKNETKHEQMPKGFTEIELTEHERELLVVSLRSPGWATTIDLIADGSDAIKKVRDLESLPAKVQLSKHEHAAVKVSLTAAISKGMFGLGEGLLELMAKFEIKRTRD